MKLAKNLKSWLVSFFLVVNDFYNNINLELGDLYCVEIMGFFFFSFQ